MSIGSFPESLSQAIIVGVMLVGRLRVQAVVARGAVITYHVANNAANHVAKVR